MTDIKTDIARAIWSELREDLDKCDLEVEDLYKGDRLWVYADVAHAAAQQEIARLRAALEVLETDAHFIFNNPPGETSQDVRDVIEWFAGSIRVALEQAK